MRACLQTVTLVLLLSAQIVLTKAKDKPKQDGTDLIQQAEDKANIFALPSFELKANVRVEKDGKTLDGSYVLLWNGPEHWREEINFPGYSELQVGGKGVVSLKRTTDFRPVRIDQLHSALGYGSTASSRSTFIRMGPQPAEKVKKIHGRNENGLKLQCVELDSVVDGLGQTREVCVDPATGTLVRKGAFLDRELSSIDSKMFPHYLSFMENGKAVAEVQITELKTTDQFPPATFDPPEGAISQPGCMNPTSPQLVKQARPIYPPEERSSRVEGKVEMYAVVGSDGVVRRLRVLSGSSAGFNESSIKAVQQWHYEPATCNGVPIDVEAVITVTYRMGV
jgi:TonB family protein